MRKFNKSIEPYFIYICKCNVSKIVSMFLEIPWIELVYEPNISTLLMTWGEIFLEKFNLPIVSKCCCCPLKEKYLWSIYSII